LNFFVTNFLSGDVTEVTDQQIEEFRKQGVDTEELAERYTGLNCDSYADTVTELKEECSRQELEYEKDDTYLSCFWFYRLLNIQLSHDEARENWIKEWDGN